ncbi:putative splicing factor 3A subunit 1 [Histomonas meleagridis]|uniref:putative splicing factor 3A subunit 1 n=1 Tax=Histomonas meleagridis TaxID=135588 RepID=UPI003559A309|nr:putative splicing factor 3A subunit 1 [Histomonas meleagridis]KAH0798423.1 putative splicing factor 3A subunit 1 [Histomonas meleagridis]
MSDLIIPPKAVCKTIEKIADYIAKFGEKLETRLREEKKGNPKFSFLIPEDPFYPYFQMKLEEAKSGAKKAAASAMEPITPIAQAPKPIPKIIQPSFTYKQPTEIGGLQLDVIHLVAQYSALYGQDFLQAIAMRESESPLFNFLKPNQPYFRFFTGLYEQYKLAIDPSNQIRRRLDQESASFLNVKSNIDAETEHQKMTIEQKKKEALEAKKDESADAFDWDEFHVLGTINYDDDQPQKQEVPEGPVVQRTLRKQGKIEQISPITGQKVSVEEFGDHLRFELQHPQYQKELATMKERKQNQNSSLAQGDEIARNLAQFARGTPEPAKNTVIWDGREETIEKTVSAAVYSLDNPEVEQQDVQRPDLKKPPVLGQVNLPKRKPIQK